MTFLIVSHFKTGIEALYSSVGAEPLYPSDHYGVRGVLRYVHAEADISSKKSGIDKELEESGTVLFEVALLQINMPY